nr:hypothetical protein [uncultured Mucilaginibacter sp.]
MELVFWYKIACLIVGLVIVFLGYMLFIKGVFNESGDVEGSFNDYKLIVRKAAPGTYFVLFGSIVIGMIVFKGFSTAELNQTKRGGVTRQDSSKRDAPKPDSIIEFK